MCSSGNLGQHFKRLQQYSRLSVCSAVSDLFLNELLSLYVPILAQKLNFKSFESVQPIELIFIESSLFNSLGNLFSRNRYWLIFEKDQKINPRVFTRAIDQTIDVLPIPFNFERLENSCRQLLNKVASEYNIYSVRQNLSEKTKLLTEINIQRARKINLLKENLRVHRLQSARFVQRNRFLKYLMARFNETTSQNSLLTILQEGLNFWGIEVRFCQIFWQKNLIEEVSAKGMLNIWEEGPLKITYTSQQPKQISELLEDSATILFQIFSTHLSRKNLATDELIWSLAFEYFSDPLMIINEDFHLLRMNLSLKNRIKDVKNYSEAAAVPKCYEVLAGLTHPCTNCPKQMRERSRLEGEAQTQICNFFGSQFEASTTLLWDNSFETNLYLQHYRDISEEYEVHQKLLQTEKMITLGLLAHNVAHGINNPIGGVLAFAQYYKIELDDTSEFYSYFNEIEQACVKCKNIINHFLNLGSDNRLLKPRRINLLTIIRSALVLLRMKALEVTIIFEADENQAYDFYGSPEELTQIIMNLVNNAIAAAMANTNERKIVKLSLKKLSDEWELKVEDNGIGIAPENISRIFEHFFTTKKETEGTGLGLAITKEIIERYQGSISVESVLKKGTVFWVKLPIKIPLQDLTVSGNLYET